METSTLDSNTHTESFTLCCRVFGSIQKFVYVNDVSSSSCIETETEKDTQQQH